VSLIKYNKNLEFVASLILSEDYTSTEENSFKLIKFLSDHNVANDDFIDFRYSYSDGFSVRYFVFKEIYGYDDINTNYEGENEPLLEINNSNNWCIKNCGIKQDDSWGNNKQLNGFNSTINKENISSQWR